MRHPLLEMPDDLRRQLPDDAFSAVMRLDGAVYRDVPGRRTLRIELGGASYFVKQHFGVGWKEVLKNLTSLRLPVFGARTEWQAIRRLEELGIPTTPAVAFGEQGCNPVTRQSFLITRDLGDITSLEEYCRDWETAPPPLHLKRNILAEVARIARVLHDHGLNHRDFYLCHFCLDQARLAEGEVRIYLIDLHRVGMRQRISLTARMKDMAALYFSVLDIGLSRRDCLRFLRLYRGRRINETLAREHAFWCRVRDRAVRLYRKFHGRLPQNLPL